MKKVMVVFGTRPEAIKMAPVCHHLKTKAHIDTVICVTAQHRAMLDQVLHLFGLKPDIDLDIMRPGQDLFELTSTILLAIRDTLEREQPDIVLVHGDTTTSFVTSLACLYSQIRVGHIEAGLRTGNLYAPFPEEYNRRCTAIATDIHFAPTNNSRDNLIKEGVPDTKIIVTGNTVIDALQLAVQKIDNDRKRKEDITSSISRHLKFDWESQKFVLITGHRRENFGKGFLEICQAIKESANLNPKVHFVYPVHLNPNVIKPVREILSALDNVWLIEPLDYFKFVYLLRTCFFVLTDSGGIQEEAPSLGKPVLVMRDVTERPEAVLAGTVKLVGAERESISRGIADLLGNPSQYSEMSRAHSPYGDGEASSRIGNAIDKLLYD